MLQRAKTIILILIPLLLGLYIRFDDLTVWLKNKAAYFYHGRAIFTGNDAFFFARYAEEFFKGIYKAGQTDFLRNVPDFEKYLDPVPLISVISGFFANLQGTYIENTSLWLVPVLSVLFSIPLVLFFKRIGYPLAGYTGAILTTISAAYLPRTTIARLDTDSLNLFFPFLIPLLLALYIETKDKKKFIYISLAGIAGTLYMWWYPKPSLLLSLFAMFIVVLFIDRKFRLTKDDFIAIGIFLLLSNPANYFQGISDALSRASSYIFMAGKKSIEGGFPNIQQWVSELQHYSFSQLSQITAGNEILFTIGLVGLAFIFIKRWKYMLLLLPFVVIGLIPLFGAMRFSMYLVPFVGVGIGAILDYIIYLFSKNKENRIKIEFGATTLVALILLVSIVYINKYAFAYVARTKFPPPLAGEFLNLKKVTEENSWIWSWWSEGYMIEYYGRRGVFVDPGSQFTPKTYFVGLSYAENRPEKARNVILSIASIGLKGIEKEMKNGVSPFQIKEKALEGEYIDKNKLKNPVYWMFTYRSLPAFDGINRIGTWNFKLQNGLSRQYQYIGTCKVLNPSLIRCSRWLIDLKNGYVTAGRRKIPIKKVFIKGKNGSLQKGLFSNKGINIILVSSNYGLFGFAMHDQPLKSMFVQMFLLRNYDNKYFELVHENFPYSVVYKVKLETF